MSKKLNGRVAVITGASKGLGKAMALSLAGEGARIALVSRSLEQLNEVGRAVKEAGAEARVFQADVSAEDQVRKLEREVAGAFGKIHILINDAGMNLRKPLVDFTLEEWHRVLDTNLTSVFLMCRSFVPHMKGEGYGRIINMASTMSWVSLPGRSAYSASKSALLGVTRALALELAADSVTVNAITGDPVEAASDIYSLGVLLYELLAGSRPYRIKAGTSAGLLERALATVKVEKPSAQVAPDAAVARGTTRDKLAWRLRGDLDAIVLKPLAKSPADRYPSAAAMADDLQRYLRGEPVQAQPDRLGYRLAKLVLRHRAGALIAAAGIAITTAGVALLLAHDASQSSEPIGTRRPADPPPSPAAMATEKSIAVLPFVDMSEKKDEEYFSDGLTEELIDQLSHGESLRVIARTSTFYYKGKQATIGQIARTLGVSYVLEGSVRKSGKALRISAQLIRASDGSHLWSQTYDRSLSDIFKVQDEIAATVAQALEAALNLDYRPSPEKLNTEAYNLVLKANYFAKRRFQHDDDRAIELYRQAIKLDPGYALAWAKLAMRYRAKAYFGEASTAEVAPKAHEAAQRALSIDPNLAYAHRALGTIYRDLDWDWKGSKAEFSRAAALDPSDLSSREDLGYLTGIETGDFGDEIRYLREDLARDPIDANVVWILAASLYGAGRLEESAEAWQNLLDLSPAYGGAQALYGQTLLFMGQYDKALEAARKESDEIGRLGVLPSVYWALGRRAESDAALEQYKSKYAERDPYGIAEIHAYRGQIDAAFEWLERAYRRHGSGMQNVKFDPYFLKLRRDPRFDALLSRMKLS